MKRTWSSKIIATILTLTLLLSIAIQPAAAAPGAAGSFSIVSMKTDGLENPLGIDSEIPEFSWQMESAVIGAAQTAYQITVLDEKQNTVWDSGKVNSAKSSGIKYAGKKLDATSAYTWKVTVWNENGQTVISDPATFETAFMSTSLDAWSGAEWIGAPELTLDATAAPLFKLQANVTIPEGNTKAAIILGANDYRLQNEYFNKWRTGKENYFKYEIDITNIDAPVLNIYVVGMPANTTDQRANGENAANIPDFTVSLRSYYNADNAHDSRLIQIDTLTNINRVSFRINGTVADSGRQLNPLGNSHDYNSFPNLNSIGFAVDAGQTAVYNNMQALNVGNNFATATTGSVLFGATTGATYAIFNGIDGVAINGSTITVTGGEKGVLCYADPSYGSAPMLRTEFKAEKEIASARMYVTARGIYEMYINGQRVGDDWFNPGNSEYRERIGYHTYDVTSLLNQGDNAVGAQLSEGWWSGFQSYTVGNYNYYGEKQALLAKLVIKYTDGTTKTVVTNDSDWQYFGDGPVEYGGFYQGERYNSLKEQAGFSTVNYDDSAWSAVEINELNAPNLENYKLITRLEEPAGVVNTITAAKLLGESRPGSGSYIYDMGENVIGVPQITIPAGMVKSGDEVILRVSEVLYPDNLAEYINADLDGMLMVENYRAALSTDFYTCKEGANVIEPHFTFHGYRYIEITGLPEALPLNAVKILVLSSVKTSATYESSNALANRLFKNVQNSQTSNFLSLPTDCPQRNERMGWTGDAQVFSRAAAYNADVLNFYRQWLATLRDSQVPAGKANAGYVPVTAPAYPANYTPAQVGGFAGVSWDAALTNIPYQMYLQYGDTDIIKENIDAIKLYLDYLDANDMNISSGEFRGPVPELTSRTGSLADWLSIDSTDATLINNAVYIYLMDIGAEMARVVGRDEIATELETKSAAAKVVWNKIYVDPATGKTRSSTGANQNTQASYATPLRYNIFADQYKNQAAAYLKEAVANPQNGTSPAYTITTGFSGTPNVVPVLTNYGYIDDAYKLFESTKYASWLYPVTQGATSVWERWNSYTVEGGFNGNNSMNSFNHFSLGAISEWMVGYQLGITGSDNAPGYQDFVLQPTPGGTFTNLNGSFESNYGTIKSGWTAADGALQTYSTVVPANTTATLYLPVSAGTQVKTIKYAEFAGFTYRNGQEVAQFNLTSGGFDFTLNNGVLTVSVSDEYTDNYKAVISVSAPNTVAVNQKFNATIVTAGDITSLKFTNENGATIGKTVLSTTKNGDQKTWVVELAIGSKGTGRIIDVTATSANGVTAKSETPIIIDVTPEVPVIGSNSLASAVFTTPTGVVNTTITLKVVTGTDITKILLYNESDATVSVISNSYIVKNGQREWLVNTKIGTKGDRKIKVVGKTASGEISNTLIAPITLTAQ